MSDVIHTHGSTCACRPNLRSIAFVGDFTVVVSCSSREFFFWRFTSTFPSKLNCFNVCQLPCQRADPSSPESVVWECRLLSCDSSPRRLRPPENPTLCPTPRRRRRRSRVDSDKLTLLLDRSSPGRSTEYRAR